MKLVKPMKSLLLAALVAVCAPCLTNLTAAAQEEDALKALEAKIALEKKQLELANDFDKELRGEVATLQQRLQTLAKTSKTLEGSISVAKQKEGELEQRILVSRSQLAKERDLSDLVYASALGYASVPPLLLALAKEERTALAITLISEMEPQLETRSSKLRDELRELGSDFDEYRAARLSQQQELAELKESQKELAALMKAKRELLKGHEKQSQRLSQDLKVLEGKAQNLRELLGDLNKKGRISLSPDAWPTTIRDFPAKDKSLASADASADADAGPSRLQLPVGAKIPRKKRGTHELPFKASPKAQVYAPYDGLVVFADKFRDYGGLIIVRHKQDYHTLLSGLDKISVGVGDWVFSGEPLGHTSPNKATTLTQELRLGANPIDPLPFF